MEFLFGMRTGMVVFRRAFGFSASEDVLRLLVEDEQALIESSEHRL